MSQLFRAKWPDPVRGPLPGDLKFSVRAADHMGWLLCDGRALSKEAYAELHSVIGTTFGGDEDTFALPDCRGRVLGSAGAGESLTSRDVGDSIGAETVRLSVSQLPAHNHTATSASAGNHTHLYQDAYFAEADGQHMGGRSVYGTKASTDGDNGYFWRQPDGSYGTTPGNLTTSEATAHTHAITVQNTGSGVPVPIVQPTMFIGYTFVYAGKPIHVAR